MQTPSETIHGALAQLLASHKSGEKGGFVIFDAGDDSEYVQFSLERDGLSLFWPNVIDTLKARIGAATQLLEQLGVRGEVADDGLYAQFGRNADLAQQFTVRAFEQVFSKVGIQRVNVNLELE